MRRLIVALRPTACYALMLAGAVSSAGVWGQESLPERQGSSSFSSSPSLACRQSWVRFQINMGLVQAVAEPSREQRCWDTVRAADRCGDSFQLQVDEQGVALTYRQLYPEGTLQCEIVRGCQLELTWRPAADAQSPTLALQPGLQQVVAYRQPCSGGAELTVGQGEQARLHAAEDLWRLMVRHPEAYEQSLRPLLTRLQKQWPIDRQLRIALRCLESWKLQPLDENAVAGAVRDLGSDSFAARRAAEQRLRTYGVAVLPHLRSIQSRDGLQPEQRVRVQHVRNMLRTDGPDTPERVAVWLGQYR